MTIGKFEEILSYIRNLINGTEWENHVFAVGGCIRDRIMDRNPKDIDLCVDLPDGGVEFANWLWQNKYTKGEIIEYKAYGTAMLSLKEFPEYEIECVQSRKEQYRNTDSRNPETFYGSIYEDAMRRDLTINALYKNISNDEIYDLTGKGLQDIEKHILRVTSTPDIVFSDDPLRILRCVKFQSRFGWTIDRDTYGGMKNNVNRLSIISEERIQSEFNEIILSDMPLNGIRTLMDIEAMHYIIPEFEEMKGLRQNKYHFGDVLSHTLKVFEEVCRNDLTLPRKERLILRLSALLHDIGKIETVSYDDNHNIHFYGHEFASGRIVRKALKRLKYSNEYIDAVDFLVKNHMKTKQWGDGCEHMKDKKLRQLQYECGDERFNRLMDLIDADNKSHNYKYCLPNQVNNIRKRTYEMMKENTSMFDYKLPVNGNDIMNYLGIKPSHIVRQYLTQLTKIAFSNPKITKEECLKLLKGIKVK